MAENEGWRHFQRDRGRAWQAAFLLHDKRQADIADALDVAPSRISHWLNAREKWPDDFEQRLAEQLGWDGPADLTPRLLDALNAIDGVPA